MSDLTTLEIAGVPLLLSPPINRDRQSPLILLWHGFASPKGEVDIAEAFLLKQVDAWKAYLGLPFFGSRSISEEESMRRLTDDYVLKLLFPVIEQASQELPRVITALRSRCALDDNAPIGLFGFSAGGLTSLLTLVEGQIPIHAAVLAGVTKDLPSVVKGYERFINNSFEALQAKYPSLQPNYLWSKASIRIKDRLNFVVHSPKIAQRKPLPAILLLHGAQDQTFTLDEVGELHHALKTEYQNIGHSEKVLLKSYSHLDHAVDLASCSSPEVQKSLADMAIDAASWFNQYL